MNIQSAISSALTSLNVEQQQSALIANNVANANTPGYVTRDLPRSELVTNGNGSGVAAGAVRRLGDDMLANNANQAAGAAAYSQTMVSGLTTVANATGEAGDTTALPTTMAALQSALTKLSATPGDTTAQTAAVAAASNLVGSFHTLDGAIATGREQADQSVAADVTAVNSDLDSLASNQASMKSALARGTSTAALQDTQATLLSDISSKLPITVLHDGQGGLTLTTDKGQTLFDGVSHKLAFSATPSIPAPLRLSPAANTGQTSGLSAVTVDGRPLATSQSGSIAGALQLRDVTLPGFADQLDQLAGNVVQGFAAADPTVASGGAGLFTISGNALGAAGTSQSGLAGEIALNAAVDPSRGGGAYRIQSGVNATGAGAASDVTTVLALVKVFGTAQGYSAGSGLAASMSPSSAASQVSGLQQSTLADWTTRNTTRTQQSSDAQTSFANQSGVSIDSEMQRLMVVQQTYSASAQVLQAANKMLEQLNQIGQAVA